LQNIGAHGRCYVQPAENYNPNFPALFSLNKLAFLMYRRTIWTDLCPVWFMIERSVAGLALAVVLRASAWLADGGIIDPGGIGR
jgi:hypothetical protein